MNELKCRVEIELITDNEVEIRLFDSFEDQKCLCWKMLVSEAKDLSSWWQKKKAFLQDGKLPLKNLRYGSVQVSMHVPSLLEVKGFDFYCSPKIVGWTLPVAAVEALGHFFSVYDQPDCPPDKSDSSQERLAPDNPVPTVGLGQSFVKDRIGVLFF